MKVRRGVGIGLLGMGLVVLSCTADRGSVPVSVDASTTPVSSNTLESRAAATRIAELRTRFRLPVRAPEEDRQGHLHTAPTRPLVPTTRPAFGAALATRFEAAAGPDAASYVRAVLPADALRGITRPAHVALPVRAGGEVKLEDDTSHLSVRFALEHVQDGHVEVAGGMALYRGALDGADVVHRVHAEGTEDFVVFETRPAREELSYSVDVSGVPGLRLVSNTLEFLDEGGTPVLRVAPPYVVEAKGERHEAKLAVNGCAYDTSPAGPWGRKVTKPGAVRCTVRVAWGDGIAYPAMVDPAWGATGSMATSRWGHTASVLPSGKVLVAGGKDYDTLASAELYDPAGNSGAGTFAATGSMATARIGHIASVLPSGKVLVAGGNIGVSPYYVASAELYDPAGNAGAGTFAATGSMVTARASHIASVLPSGKVLVAGGIDDSYAILASAELFDPAGNAGVGAFTATGSMTTVRTGPTASLLPSGKVLVAGGLTAGPVFYASAELFDPAGNAGAGAFVATGSMGTARAEHTASVLPSGKVLVAGGTYYAGGTFTYLASAELFDPAGNAGAGAFAPTGPMATTRAYHTASALPSGKALVVGGSSGIAFLASAELFDPTGNAGAGTFAAAGSIATARYNLTSSTLLSGKVLVAGGYDNSWSYASAELFGGALGDTCAGNGPCLTGFCVDGVCCDTACSGTCQACAASLKQSAVADGTCGPSRNGTDPRNECAPSGLLCGADGYCNGAGACRAATPGGISCGGGVCQGTVARGQLCDGAGTCAANGAGVECAPFLCANGGCTMSCVTSSGCAPSAWCKAGTCTPKASNGSACLLAEACSSGFCADGVCCDKACTGQCEACDSVAGTCGPIAGTPRGSRPGCSPGSGDCQNFRVTCIQPAGKRSG